MEAIWITVILGVITAVTGGLAGHLAAQKGWHKWAFWGAALLTVGLLFVQGIVMQKDIRDAEERGKQEQAQLNRIEKSTGQAPQVVINPQINVPTPPLPKEHTRATFVTPFGTGTPSEGVLPYHRDERIELNVGYKNGGDFTLRDGAMHSMILIVPLSESNEVFRKTRSKLRKVPPIKSGALVPHTTTISFHTEFGPTLTDDDVAKLNNGAKVLCVLSLLEWRDDTGLYETDFCECLGAEYPSPSGGFNWHVSSDTDIEHKLR